MKSVDEHAVKNVENENQQESENANLQENIHLFCQRFMKFADLSDSRIGCQQFIKNASTLKTDASFAFASHLFGKEGIFGRRRSKLTRGTTSARNIDITSFSSCRGFSFNITGSTTQK